MSYTNWDEDWYEPSEFDIMMTEFKETIKSNAKQEIKDEIAGLKNELATLKEVKENWKKIEQENSRLKLEVQRIKEEAERNANKAKLSELLKYCYVKAYQIDYKSDYIKPKCDKCNEQRNITFYSPNGIRYTEQCECGKRKLTYFPIETSLYEVHLPYNAKDGRLCPIYLDSRDKDDDYMERTVNSCVEDKSFEEIDKTWKPYFNTLEYAQAFCDWKNNKEENK